MDYLKRAKELEQELVANRRHIHENPEVGNDLPETVKYVKAKLAEMGIEATDFVKGGLVATLGKPGKTILLRADMDALPMQEASGLPFASKNNYAHTCGHDMHTATLLGAAKLLKENEANLQGTVKLMFQPDEERLGGAQAMVDAGILENPKVDAAMAFHVFPGEHGPGGILYRTGPVAASSDSFRITVEGHGGHGAMPDTTHDPINAAVHIHIALQEILAREVSPQQPLVLTVGQMHAGNAPNIIPQFAEMEGTIRTFDNDVRTMVKERLVEIAQLTAKTFRCEAKVEFLYGTPPNTNDEPLTEELASYLKEYATFMEEAPVLMGSEDFAVVANEVPASFFVLCAGGEEEMYLGKSNHHPAVCFNEGALTYGAAMFANAATKWLANHSK